ncbi:MAG: hypothetical protein R3236_09860 [Phycisphaeraceae bacterium]|nr:hypothetical protein [Phycisphaeraceae bacterium]
MKQKIAKAITLCLNSTRRFDSLPAAHEALNHIATLPVDQWQPLCSDLQIPEQVLSGLVTQCGCALETLEWMKTEGMEQNIDSAHQVVQRFESSGEDARCFHTDPWRLYWGAWFLESKLPD